MPRAWKGVSAALIVWACSASSQGAGGAAGWLSRDREQQAAQLERQLRGFDVAMLETGHRHAELHAAGRAANWPAAAYHAQKIRLVIENGLERRPQRAASARAFLAGPLAALEAAIAAQDPALFASRFDELTAACNTCHAAEQVGFFVVRTPEAEPPRSGPREP